MCGVSAASQLLGSTDAHSRTGSRYSRRIVPISHSTKGSVIGPSTCVTIPGAGCSEHPARADVRALARRRRLTLSDRSSAAVRNAADRCTALHRAVSTMLMYVPSFNGAVYRRVGCIGGMFQCRQASSLCATCFAGLTGSGLAANINCVPRPRTTSVNRC